jgi:hypothetical protein
MEHKFTSVFKIDIFIIDGKTPTTGGGSMLFCWLLFLSSNWRAALYFFSIILLRFSVCMFIFTQ